MTHSDVMMTLPKLEMKPNIINSMTLSDVIIMVLYMLHHQSSYTWQEAPQFQVGVVYLGAYIQDIGVS